VARVNEHLPGPVRVSIPPHPGYLHVLRAITGSVAARLRMPVDAIEDLRLAVHETASYLIELEPDGSTLTLELTPTDRDLRAVVSLDADVRVWPPSGFEGSLAWKVIKGLSDESMVRRLANAPAIEMRKRTLEP
jgi:hypothetical protein